MFKLKRLFGKPAGSDAALDAAAPPPAPVAPTRPAEPDLRRVKSDGHPNGTRLMEMLRDLPALRWNSKVLGAELADRYYADVRESMKPLRNDAVPWEWRATQFSDFSQGWFIDSCARLRRRPVLHRKLWEDAFVMASLERAGATQPDKRGIGFGCGEERFPAYFASRGVHAHATDLNPESQAAQGWIATHQHASREKLFHMDIVDRAAFDQYVTFSHADMNDIPADLDGQYDFCWSVCAFEHLGSIEAGLKFIERSMALLKPGGISVHTTEFNYTSNDETIDDWGTVLFRKRDFEELARRLREAGHIVPPLNFDVGRSPVDRYIDVPPYPGSAAYYDPKLESTHLKLMVDGFPSTCFAVVVQKAP